MRLKEEQKIILIGILLVGSIGLQIAVDHLANSNNIYYQDLQKENISILKRYGKINNVGLNYINLNSKISKLFSWRQGDKPLGEAQVKTVSLYHELSGEEQQEWGEKTLFEYYFNESHQMANQINNEYSDLSNQTIGLEQTTDKYNKIIKSNNWWRSKIVFVNLIILVLCIFLYYGILTGIISRLKK